MIRSALRLAAVLAVLVAASPAQAATLPVADFKPGSTVGVGFAGFSYDWAAPSLDLGAALDRDLSSQRFKLSARGLYRFMTVENLNAAWVGGVQYDPGTPGSRSYLVPDAGVALAYTFPANMPITLRLALTVTMDQYRYVDPLSPAPAGNLLQQLTLGPNTTVGAGIRVNDHLELTVGGGTIVGARLTN